MYIKTDEDSVFTRSYAEFLVSFSIDQSFKHLSKLVCVTGTLENLNLNKKILQKYCAAAIFFLYGNKNGRILRGQRCLRTRTFILFGLCKPFVVKFFNLFFSFWCIFLSFVYISSLVILYFFYLFLNNSPICLVKRYVSHYIFFLAGIKNNAYFDMNLTLY